MILIIIVLAVENMEILHGRSRYAEKDPMEESVNFVEIKLTELS